MLRFCIIREQDTAKAVNSIPMLKALLLITFLILGSSDVISAPVIRSVQIEGNIRVPAASMLARISAVPNEPLNQANIREDLKTLDGLGLFKNIFAASRSAGPGQVDLIYHVCESPFISSFSIEGIDRSLEKQVRAHLQETGMELHPATPFNPYYAKRAALAVRSYLRHRNYPNAKVQVSTVEQGRSIRIMLRALPGQRLKVGAVRFIGNESIPERELLGQMQHARPASFWTRWRDDACFVPEELNSDLERIRLYYLAHGFAAALIGKPRIFATGVKEKQPLEIEIPISEGGRYSLVSIGIEGDAKEGSADVHRIIGAMEVPREYDYSSLESSRQKIADMLGSRGYAMARVYLRQSINESDRTVESVYGLDPGDRAVIGRIVFQGNHRIPDKFLRRELRLGEGEVFDTTKLDQSVERLNKGNLVHEIIRSDVVLKLNTETNLLDITFHIREKDRQAIYLTGGTGGLGGGYLGILYRALNLMRLGEILSMELDGGAAQSNMLLNIAGDRFLGSPFALALSIFNRTTGINVANIVPGPEDIVEIFSRHSAGAGLSGSYPLTANLRAGLAFEVRQDSIKDFRNVNSVRLRSLKSELMPFMLLDRTSGSGLETRGFRARYDQSWIGSSSLKSLDSTRESAQFTYYIQDPWIRDRNSFAFHFQSGHVHPLGDKRLSPERRFYPGNDIVRGFGRGALSPWAAVPGNPNLALQNTGADTVFGLSAEYRVPIHGALSSLGFFDLGWAHLNPKSASQLGTEAYLIENANGVLRSSLGGEIRLQLPMIQQPARFIFSWNPLRLSRLFAGSSLRLAEPGTVLRFALGAPF